MKSAIVIGLAVGLATGTAFAAPVSTPPSAWATMEGKTETRQVCVMAFEGKGADALRQAVLDSLSEHIEVEVIGAKDVEVTAKRLGVSMSDEHGRSVLAEDLGVFAWVDGDASRGVARLTAADGKPLAEVKFSGSESRSGEAATAKVWSAFGHYISDAALREHVLVLLRASAQHKLEGAEQEKQKQIQLALERLERRTKHLAALQVRAAEVLLAQDKELAHQQELAVAKVRKAQEEAAHQAELARQAELAQQAELARQAESARHAELAAQQAAAAQQQQLAIQQAAARQAALSKQTAAAPQPAAQPAYAQPQPAYAQPQPVYARPAYPQPVYPQPVYAQPTYAQPQHAYAQPAYAQPQPAYAQPQPTYAQPQPQSAEPLPSSAAPVSPETQKWLERRRAAGGK